MDKILCKCSVKTSEIHYKTHTLYELTDLLAAEIVAANGPENSSWKPFVFEPLSHTNAQENQLNNRPALQHL